MILPAWQLEISQSQVQDALNYPFFPIQAGMSNLYSSSMETASAANTFNCLMYHNLAMGVNDAQDAATAIYTPFNNGTNMNLGNWASYNSDPNIILTWTITNNNIENTINGQLYIVDTAGNFTSFYNYNVGIGGGTDNQTNYNTGISVSTLNSKYLIAIDAQANYIGPPPPPGAGVTNNTAAGTDTDGVGGGTARVSFNPPNFDFNNPLGQIRIVNHTISGIANIALNKRTSFDIVFN